MSDIKKNEMLKLENQLCFPLYAAARKVVGLYTPYLKELGLTYTQYIVFLVLWERDGIPVGELGKRLYLDNGTLTPLLKKLETAGYLIRTRDKDDERVVTVSLTDAGKKLKEAAWDIPSKVSAGFCIEDGDAADLYTLLYQLLRGEENG